MLSNMQPLKICTNLHAEELKAKDSHTVRVLSYNLHAGRGMDDVVDFSRIAEVVKSLNPDVASVQEVDLNHPRSGNTDMMRCLCDLTGMNGAFGANLNWNDGKSEYGNGFLSGNEFEVLDNLHYEPVDKGEPRGALILRVHGPIEYYFVATHFPLNAGRPEMVEKITSYLEKHHYFPAILAGDLNSVPDSEALSVLRRKWTVANDCNPMLSCPADVPKEQIDYVAFMPKNAFTVQHCQVIPEKIVSDHRPVLAVLKIS